MLRARRHRDRLVEKRSTPNASDDDPSRATALRRGQRPARMRLTANPDPSGSAAHQKYWASLCGGLPMGGTTSPVVSVGQRGNGASGVESPFVSYWNAACLKHQPTVLL